MIRRATLACFLIGQVGCYATVRGGPQLPLGDGGAGWFAEATVGAELHWDPSAGNPPGRGDAGLDPVSGTARVGVGGSLLFARLGGEDQLGGGAEVALCYPLTKRDVATEGDPVLGGSATIVRACAGPGGGAIASGSLYQLPLSVEAGRVRRGWGAYVGAGVRAAR
ncbi:MAG TPA: hypothetical protein VL172_23085, partial [Kofleriaceae bacterium]|nr:hypothetical protein [Kofleriaceae bacterium]